MPYPTPSSLSLCPAIPAEHRSLCREPAPMHVSQKHFSVFKRKTRSFLIPEASASRLHPPPTRGLVGWTVLPKSLSVGNVCVGYP